MKGPKTYSGRSQAVIQRHLAENLKRLDGVVKVGQQKQKGSK